jgi:hypothetical protein
MVSVAVCLGGAWASSTRIILGYARRGYGSMVKVKIKQTFPSAVLSTAKSKLHVEISAPHRASRGQTLSFITSAKPRLRVLAEILRDFCRDQLLPSRLPYPITNLILQHAQSDIGCREIIAKLREDYFVQLDRASNPSKSREHAHFFASRPFFLPGCNYTDAKPVAALLIPLYFSRILQRVSEC